MSQDSQYRPVRSAYKVAADSNEFFIPPGTDQMINKKYKEWLKRREGKQLTSTYIKFYPRKPGARQPKTA